MEFAKELPATRFIIFIQDVQMSSCLQLSIKVVILLQDVEMSRCLQIGKTSFYLQDAEMLSWLQRSKQ